MEFGGVIIREGGGGGGEGEGEGKELLPQVKWFPTDFLENELTLQNQLLAALALVIVPLPLPLQTYKATYGLDNISYLHKRTGNEKLRAEKIQPNRIAESQRGANSLLQPSTRS